MSLKFLENHAREGGAGPADGRLRERWKVGLRKSRDSAAGVSVVPPRSVDAAAIDASGVVIGDIIEKIGALAVGDAGTCGDVWDAGIAIVETHCISDHTFPGGTNDVARILA